MATAKDQYNKNMEKVGLLTCEKSKLPRDREGMILSSNFRYSVSFLFLFPVKVCGGDLPYVSPDTLEEKHQFYFREALHTFSSTKKMGGQEFCDRYQAQLEKELEEMWQSLSKHNEVREYSINTM